VGNLGELGDTELIDWVMQEITPEEIARVLRVVAQVPSAGLVGLGQSSFIRSRAQFVARNVAESFVAQLQKLSASANKYS